jgi:hypothetical protein
MNRESRIHIPRKLANLLHRDRNLEAGVLGTLSDFEPWLEDNKLVFFPEFTDHGPDHIASVISTATFLITPQSWKLLTAGDAAALIIGILLHDCAMHISEDGFIELVSVGNLYNEEEEPSWPQLWEGYIREAVRFDGRKLFALFGDTRPVEIPRLSTPDLNRRDRMLIGDFLRRHHARLASEIAVLGVPGPSGERLKLSVFDNEIKKLFGWIARSHGISIRQAVSHFQRNARRLNRGVHTSYIMALLRIADYLQIDAPRAPKQLLQVRSLRSPVSQSEWAAHGVIVEVDTVDDDRESLYVVAHPPTSKAFVHVSNLLKALQSELDQTWAVLGEVYGPVSSLQKFGLQIRRIRSNLDDVESFAREVNYVPTRAAFTTATADLLKLLIGPLYNYRSEIGIRELVQNAVDAVLEHRDTVNQQERDGENPNRLIPDVTIHLVTASEGSGLTITDRGVGMTVDVLLNYFLRAGASFRYDDAWGSLHTDDFGRSRVLRSGRFGIGALASFLLADSLVVTTCTQSDNAAITFEARLEDEHIELRRTSAPRGTSIHIPLRAETANYLGQVNLWDFYCLADPAVERRINGETLEQRETWPGCAAPLPPSWRRLQTSDFADVQWSFWEPEGRTQIACNGIRVEEIQWEAAPSRDREREYYDDDESEPEDETAKLRLSIFDKDARLPVNLQRTSVTALPFREVLHQEIAKDFLAFAAIRLPADTNLNSVFDPALHYPGQPLPDDSLGHSGPHKRNSERKLRAPCFFSSPDGWILPVYSALRHFRPQRFVQIVATPPGLEFYWTNADYVCPSLAEFERYGRSAFTKRFLSLTEGRSAIKILVPKHTMRDLMKEEEVAERMLSAQTTPFRGGYVLIDFDNRNSSVLFAESSHLFEVAERGNNKGHYFIAETIEDNEAYDLPRLDREHDDVHRLRRNYDFGRWSIIEGPKLPISYELAVSVWADLGIYSIPFALEARSFILEHPQIREYAAAHALLWDSAPGLSYEQDDDAYEEDDDPFEQDDSD